MDVPHIHVADANGCLVPLSLAQLKDPVEFSNACRAFYKARVEATAKMKERVRAEDKGTRLCNSSYVFSNDSSNNNDNYNSSKADGIDNVQDAVLCIKEERQHDFAGPQYADVNSSLTTCVNNGEKARTRRSSHREKSTVDSAMGVLRREMADLMDLDLCLMKQLLILNEEIEDLKWRRRCAWADNCRSSQEGSWDMMQSAASLSNTLEPALKFSTPSSLSLQLDGDESLRFSVYDDDDQNNTFNRGKRQQNKHLRVMCMPATDRGSATTSPSEPDDTNKTETRHHLQRRTQSEGPQSTKRISATCDSAKLTQLQSNHVLANCRENKGHPMGHDDSVTNSENRLKVFPNQDHIPVRVDEISDKHSSGSPNLSRCKTGVKHKSHNLVLGNVPRTPPHSVIYRSQNCYGKLDSFSPSQSVTNSGASCQCISSSNHQTKTTNNPRNNDDCRPTRVVSQELPGPSERTNTAKTSSFNTSLLQTSVVKSNTGLDPPKPPDLSSGSGQNCPVPGHRKKSRGRFNFKSSMAHTKIPSSSASTHRQARKKTKGTNNVTTGDAESHDSGINDVFT
ncbi:hypothetical protein EGW08_015167 [Elysia chlorotica]|uniref:Uncharacterized protein n=1 Tax=Elysia chlorotica TaxID=188477 RepID=A0A3S1BX00_ELYCH|nr:hypothetical protein EGW08_015167 [Elysia chlorotica]